MYNLPITLLRNSDGSYTVVSNIFNIVTEGATLEEAMQNGREALNCHIEGLLPGDDEYEILQSLATSINTSVLV
ncbi:MAG: type II toxin-antitoxin system HicB family antitoxin [Candidatus Peribacteria bacterium]|nr:MAG: type II toxin-antitoxin system HicB family antitoxin [Candidatus Peribacteria bacterium]